MIAEVPKRIFLIDGSALAYRSYYAFIKNPLVNSKGENTSAVFGFLNTLIKIMNDERPTYLAVAFDSPEPTFRHRAFEQYKATRQKMPEEMAPQLPWIKEFVEAMGVRTVEMAGYEADDLMAALALKAVEKGIEAVLVTSDKDFFQILREGVRILSLGGRGERFSWIDDETVEEQFGIPAVRFVDFLSLMGDQSDNIPGVRGIGEKTALKLMRKYGGLDEVFENLEMITPAGLRKKLREGKSSAYLSKSLVTLKTDVPVDVEAEGFSIGPRDEAKLAELIGRFELNSLRRKLAGLEEKPYREKRLEGKAGLRSLLQGGAGEGVAVAFAGTPSSGPPERMERFEVALCADGKTVWTFPLGLGEGAGGTPEETLEAFRELLGDSSRVKIGWGLGELFKLAERLGVGLKGGVFDCRIAGFLAWGEEGSMGRLAGRYLGVVAAELGKEGSAGGEAASRAWISFQLWKPLSEELDSRGLGELFAGIEMPLVGVLAEMESVGIKVEIPPLLEMSKEMEGLLKRIEARIFALAGHEFNVASSKQLSQVLFGELKLPALKKTKTGYSTDQEVLLQLAPMHEIVSEILSHRELSKLKSTYVDALPRMVDSRTGRIHTRFDQVGTVTGRLSSSEPNLQNIPAKSEYGRRIRELFVPGEADWRITSADYSQIELRILAHLSGDENLISAFDAGRDVHTETAVRLFSVGPDEVTPEMRSRAKTVNFGVLYGMSAHGLALELRIPRAEAKKFIDQYFEKFPCVRDYLRGVVEEARARGFVQTILGRRRYIPQLASGDSRTVAHGERIALNTPIQGSAADLIKKAMVDIHNMISEIQLKAKLLLQVHDELLFEHPAEETDVLTRRVVELMSGAQKLRVPLLVKIGTGSSWGEAEASAG